MRPAESKVVKQIARGPIQHVNSLPICIVDDVLNNVRSAFVRRRCPPEIIFCFMHPLRIPNKPRLFVGAMVALPKHRHGLRPKKFVNLDIQKGRRAHEVTYRLRRHGSSLSSAAPAMFEGGSREVNSFEFLFDAVEMLDDMVFLVSRWWCRVRWMLRMWFELNRKM